MEYLVNEKRNNQFFPGNCIYIPENYPEDWRERLEAGEVVSYEEDGEQCEIWLEMEQEEAEQKPCIHVLDNMICGKGVKSSGKCEPPCSYYESGR